MEPEQQDNPLMTLWERQSVWSQAANQVKHGINRARFWALLLAITGAVLSTAAAQFGPFNATVGWVLGLLSAIVLALAPAAGRGATATATRDWTRLRSVSEAYKTEVYTFLAGVAPYRGEDRQSVLLHRCQKVADEASDLLRYTGGITGRRRQLPAVHDVASFIELRVNAQIAGYYRPKAAEYRRRLSRLRVIEVGLAAAAALLAAVTGFFPAAHLGAWVAVVTTLGVAVATHVAAQRYEYQQVEFTRTADQLEDLRSRYAIGEFDPDTFVAAAEQVISIQNDAWMVKLVSGEEPAA
ncbi:DUF4231 domain-containing protein [Dactylosporangium sp. CA-092794]|uniref:DUF4231 domain-containing protein n=1 Tax=Dactylosporangium sp. CA-092794 TaxID=3239929 RepID=UPI003D8D1EC1